MHQSAHHETRTNGSAKTLDATAKPHVIAFDFGAKAERQLTLDEANVAMQGGAFLWIDLDANDAELVRSTLSGLGVEEPSIDDALTHEPTTSVSRYDHYIHFVLSGCRQRGTHFDLERVDSFVLARCLVTLHTGPVAFLSAMRRDYHSDFLRFAETPSFLIYEIWDHLVEDYLAVQKKMEERVEELQSELRTDAVADAVFARISDLGADLLHFRKVVLPARAVLTDLSTRRSIFISEVTQPFLANMVGKLEHVLQDVLVDRDILSESLNLYMSIVSHRTNETMKRLTSVSIVFLPLTFICGIYGMNFEELPELHWRNGYVFFWALICVTVFSLLLMLRKAKLL
ncbi:MAG TPA: magnesium transporter CorA family protein [Polyangiaceae bacterium]|jgi:magnesium transporter|nr:magnesium transporter CorA family protein [Polyangiaceae bacterium]